MFWPFRRSDEDEMQKSKRELAEAREKLRREQEAMDALLNAALKDAADG